MAEEDHSVQLAACSAAEAGALQPVDAKTQTALKERGVLGYAEDIAMTKDEFDLQMRSFRQLKRLRAPELEEKITPGGVPIIEITRSELQKLQTNENVKKPNYGNPLVLSGPEAYCGPWGKDSESEEEVKSEDYEEEEEVKPAIKKTFVVGNERQITPGSEKTVFHGKEQYDYLGRSYMHPPLGVKQSSNKSIQQECFLPKRLLHTYKGHSQAVNCIRLLPKTAHLILSASMDTKIKLWSTVGDRKVLRTYLGHNKGVRDLCFNNSGQKFLSASYDKYIKLWDTETGKCESCFSTGKVPYCVKFNPSEHQQHIFLTGQQDRKIYQYDTRSGSIVQEYDQHMGAVNTITFIDNNRRFVSTSDDKSLRAWEYDIPVVIKYVAEPHMHSMPSATLSPRTHKYLACQSLDNQILIFNTAEGVKLNRQKCFKGHMVSGYACQVGFSPDERFICSGDSSGSVFFWEFKSMKLLKKLQAHDNVVMGIEWHPYETSKVFTCSWDGTIKLFD